MTEETFEDIGHMFCGNCRYFSHKNPCRKRIDHKAVRFAVPWFKSYDCNQFSGCICADFEPAQWCNAAHSLWTNFSDYWEWYSKEWIPYGNTNSLVFFTLDGDTSVRYGVRLMDFVNGTMFEGRRLKAVEKRYYKRHPVSEAYPTGYELVREKIDKVETNIPWEVAAMASRVYIEPDALWDFYLTHEGILKTEDKVVAQRDDYGVEIHLSDDAGLPLISVTVDGEEVDGETAGNADECEQVALELYDEYLSSEYLTRELEDDNMLIQEQMDMIDEREGELDAAMDDFLAALCPTLKDVVSPKDISSIYGDLKETICQHLYDKYKVSVYRPCFLEDEDGVQEFSEFPYEALADD